MCDCGIVPIVRRLLNKGMPVSCGLTFMLASPIVNPIVAFSTYAAFRGQAPGLNTLIRLASGYAIAVLAGLAVSRFQPEAILKTEVLRRDRRRRTGLRVAAMPDEVPDDNITTFCGKIVAAVRMASDDFIDTAVYFMLGAAVAAVFNTAVNQAVILPLARHDGPDPASDEPGGVASGEGAIWAASTVGATIVRIDPTTEVVTQTVSLPGSGLSAVASGDRMLWAADPSDQLAFDVDPATGSLVRTLALTVQRVRQRHA